LNVANQFLLKTRQYKAQLRNNNSKNQPLPDIIEPETHLSAAALRGGGDCFAKQSLAESFGIKAAQEWADGFEFPPGCKSDVRQ
jgi:hypothetical protein